MKKSFACLLLLATSFLTGCFSQTNAEPVKKLTWWTPLYPHVAASSSNFAQTELYQELMRRTNTQIEFIHPTQGREDQDFNILIKSGSLPDLIEKNFLRYPQGPTWAIENGIIMPLDECIEQYSPNYKKVLEEHPEWDRQVTTADGTHYTYAWFRGDESLLFWMGPQIRSDLLEQAQLPAPETISDWEVMLRKFKEMGVKYPLSGDNWQLHECFSGAYGFVMNYYQDDGVVKHGLFAPECKEYLALLAKWYQEGLLDPEFFSQTESTLQAKIIAGDVGSYIGSAGGMMGKSLSELRKQGASLMGVKYPVLHRGDLPEFVNQNYAYYPDTSVALSAQCRDVEAAARLLDYGYSQEGHMLYNFGIEGVSYTMEDGYPRYTELITNNPQGLYMQNAMSIYMASAYGGPFVQDKREYEQYLLYDEQKQAVAQWQIHGEDHRVSPSAWSNEEKEHSHLLDSYISESILSFITGQRSLNEYDAFLTGLRELDFESLIVKKQAAVDAYLGK